jgi:thioredoxin 1
MSITARATCVWRRTDQLDTAAQDSSAADPSDRPRREHLVNHSLSASSQNARSPSHDGIPSLDAAGFEARVLRGHGPIAVEFMSYSCAYCGAMEPVLQQVAETLRSREPIFRVNVAVEVDLASAYEIEGTPTLVMFSEGQEVGRSEGLDPDAATVLEAVTAPFGMRR